MAISQSSSARGALARIALTIVCGFALLPSVASARTAADALRTSNVAIESSANISGDDRSRLEAAASDLAANAKPTKFAIYATKSREEIVSAARSIRASLSFRGTVVTLSRSPGRLGFSGPFQTSVGKAA